MTFPHHWRDRPRASVNSSGGRFFGRASGILEFLQNRGSWLRGLRQTQPWLSWVQLLGTTYRVVSEQGPLMHVELEKTNRLGLIKPVRVEDLGDLSPPRSAKV